MDHVVYLDVKAKEMDKLATGEKTMIIRGAAGRKLPHGRVFAGDTLYFLYNDGEAKVQSMATVYSVVNSAKMTEEESIELVNQHQDYLRLTPEQTKRWSGKRYIVLIEITGFKYIDAFEIDKSNYGNMDDWLPVEKIDSVRK